MGLLLLAVNVWGLAMPFSANGADRALRIVAFGDSLTAGFMLPPADSFPAQLQRELTAKGHKVEVINAGISGDTTGAGLSRLEWAIGDHADAVILELGANDALRGIEPAKARANLAAILSRLAARGLPVLIAGMRAPNNWGENYVREFDAIFPELAKAGGHLLYPFFLDGVATDAKLNLGDGLHPNREGVARIVAGIVPHVEQLIERARSKAAAAAKG
ncbi:MAG: arylesterase [Pseudomonadota bacterium]